MSFANEGAPVADKQPQKEPKSDCFKELAGKQARRRATPDDPEQYRRFVETARELGADESPDAMDRAFEQVVGKPKKEKDWSRACDQKK